MYYIFVGFLVILLATSALSATNAVRGAGAINGLNLIPPTAAGDHVYTLPPQCPPVTCPYNFYRMDAPGGQSYWSCYNPAWNAPYFTVNILSAGSIGAHNGRAKPWGRAVNGNADLAGNGATFTTGIIYNLGHAVTRSDFCYNNQMSLDTCHSVNRIPQYFAFNQGPWSSLEKALQLYVQRAPAAAAAAAAVLPTVCTITWAEYPAAVTAFNQAQERNAGASVLIPTYMGKQFISVTWGGWLGAYARYTNNAGAANQQLATGQSASVDAMLGAGVVAGNLKGPIEAVVTANFWTNPDVIAGVVRATKEKMDSEEAIKKRYISRRRGKLGKAGAKKRRDYIVGIVDIAKKYKYPLAFSRAMPYNREIDLVISAMRRKGIKVAPRCLAGDAVVESAENTETGQSCAIDLDEELSIPSTTSSTISSATSGVGQTIQPWCVKGISPAFSTLSLNSFATFSKGLSSFPQGAQGLTQREAAAVYAYPLETDRIYKKVNCYKNNAGLPQTTPMPPFVTEFDTLFRSALSKLPKSTSSTYRGTHMSSTPTQGDSLRNLGYVASSTDPTLAMKFAGCNPCYRIEFVNPMGTSIHSITGGSTTEVVLGADICWNVASVDHYGSSTLMTNFPWAQNVKSNNIYLKLQKSTCTAQSKNILEEVPNLNLLDSSTVEILEIEKDLDDFDDMAIVL